MPTKLRKKSVSHPKSTPVSKTSLVKKSRASQRKAATPSKIKKQSHASHPPVQSKKLVASKSHPKKASLSHKLKDRPVHADDMSKESKELIHTEKNDELMQHDPTQIYLKEIGYTSLLTADEEVKYGRLSKKGNVEARKTMIVSNLRLVVNIARHYYNRGMDFSDLIGEGNLGLLRAVEKFDPERGFRFSTYATWWIRQTIERAIMNQTRTIRLPIHVLRELNSCLIAGKELMKTQGHEATTHEIAAALDRTLSDVEQMMALNEHTVSLDADLSHDNNGKTLVDVIPDSGGVDPANMLINEHLHEKLESGLSSLNPKQAEVIARRFGLRGFERQTLEEVGKAVGLTRERVRQIQMQGLKALRELLEVQGYTGDEVE